ncbi:mitochondrial heat shock protein Hsp10 [Savitreella phatthalungensis]
MVAIFASLKPNAGADGANPGSDRMYVSSGRGGAGNVRRAKASGAGGGGVSVGPPTLGDAGRSRSVGGVPAGEEDDGGALTRVVTKSSTGARFATGRGGRGNMLPAGETPVTVSDKPIANTPQPQPKDTVVTGRGGAGNLKDAKTGRRASASLGIGRRSSSQSSAGGTATGNEGRPIWGGSVPRIDDDFAVDDSADDGDGSATRQARSGSMSSRNRRLSTSSSASAPAASPTFMGMFKRRMSAVLQPNA